MKSLIDDIKEYKDLYSDIPFDLEDRLNYLFYKLKYKKKDFQSLQLAINKLGDMEYEEFNFVIYLCPKPSPRPRLSFKTKTFYVFNAADNIKLFKEFLESLKDKRPDIIVTPCYVDIDSYCPLPTGLNKVNVVLAELGLIPVVSTPDFDNLAKTYTDLTQKNLLLNDSLIQRGTSSKHYSCKPRIEIRFRYMKKFDTPYTKNKVEKWNYFKELKNKPDVDSIL